MKTLGARASKSKKAGLPLNNEDLDRLHSFRISDKLIAAAGLYRVDSATARAEGFRFGSADADLSGRVYPYKDENANVFNARLRRDNPDIVKGRTKNKYISLSSEHAAHRGLYWPPGAWELLKKPATEVVLVEAETSALAGTAFAIRSGSNRIFVAIGGCQGWRDKETGVVLDLEHLSGRNVYILFDSNVSTKQDVGRAELELAAHLARLQCHVRCLRLPIDVNGPDDFLAAHKSDVDFKRLLEAPTEPWLAEIGESYEKYLAAKPPDFVIDQFLQTDGATFIGGLSGHGKTFLLLSMVHSLLTGKPLFGHLRVVKQASRVIYLTPEITLASFKRRAELFHLGPYIQNGRLIVRTLSAYPMLQLTDPALLLSVRGADLFLDTAVRFMEGDESSSTDNDRGLAAGIFRLLQSGARTITGSHHSPKGFETQTYMSLENILRGSGDIGAMLCTAWGVRMLDKSKTFVHVENIKARDFEPPLPFQIQGHPQINDGRGFQMVKKPGECGHLCDYVTKASGRPPSLEKQTRMKLIAEGLDDRKTQEQIAEMLKAANMTVPKPGVLRKEMSIVRRARKDKF